MTRLTKAVKRETCKVRRRGRPVIVAMEPGDVLAFREKGRRTWYRVSVGACFDLAVKRTALRDAAAAGRFRRRKV